MEDYEIDYHRRCPFCGHDRVHWRYCTHCDNGEIDDCAEDPIWYNVGEWHSCDECNGAGIETWCPHCGENLSEA